MKTVLKSALVALSLCTVATTISAQPLSFLAQSNPKNLGLFVWVSDDCPFNESETIKLAVHEFEAAGLTPTEELKLNLTLNVDCMSIENENDKKIGISTYIETRWGTQIKGAYNVLFEEPNYGSYMISSADQPDSHYLKKISESIQEALSDYKKVNF